MRKRKLKNLIFIAIPVLTVIAIGILFIFVLKPGIPTSSRVEQNSSSSDESSNVTVSGNSDDYTSETNYTGKMADYPELYQYPFKKSSLYVSNKDFTKAHADEIKECSESATTFMNNLFCINYRSIATDKDSFISSVMENADYSAYITQNLNKDNEKTMLLYDYIDGIADYYTKNEVQIDAKFVTDESLVYKDFYTFVRGELVLTVYADDDKDLKISTGKEYDIPMEVALKKTDSGNYLINSFGKMDEMYFVNP